MPKSVEFIPTYNVNELEKAVKRLNKKALKLGTSPLVLTIEDAEPYRTSTHPYTGNRLVEPWVVARKKAILEYEIPTLMGWELIARMDIYDSNDGSMVMVSAVPEKEVPEIYKNLTSIECDHCGHNRYRNHSILIRHLETGEYKQVGSTCVKDFFGGNDPEKFMFSASIMFRSICAGLNDERGFGAYGADNSGYSLESVMAYTSASIRKFGWLSKGKAKELDLALCTADHVAESLSEPSSYKCEENCAYPSDRDWDNAEKAMEWWKNVDPKNDYLLNCFKLVKMGYVPFKFMGFAASMLPTWEREMDKIEKRERELAGKKTSNWVGEIGDRVRGIRAKVVFCRDIESYYGHSTLYTFVADDGAIFKTFYSGYSWNLDKGDVVVLDGTVKKHDEFRGEKQTMLNRVNVKMAPDEEFTVEEFAVA